MLPFIPEEAQKILDVGCADGTFGHMLKMNNPSLTVWGVEPHLQAAKAASKKLDNVVHGVFEANFASLGDAKFDTIIFNDVLEHLISPEESIKLCHNYLIDKGYIVASIPNILYYPMLREILTTQDWRYREHGTLDNTHLRFFTKKSIVRLFVENGFEIVKIAGINPRQCGNLFSILNTIFYKKLADWKYLQFAVQARRKG